MVRGSIPWPEVIERFKLGETIADVARAYGLGYSTVAIKLQHQGVKRRDYPRTRVAARAAEALLPVPPLDLRPDAGAAEIAETLSDWSTALAGAGLLRKAEEALRLAQMHRRLLTAEAATTGRESAPSPAAPTLRAAQRVPGGDWRTWLYLGGRGAGKTLAGAAWLAGRAREVGRLALVGPTLLDVRDVMIEGPSGLRGLGAAFGPEGGLPTYVPSKRKLTWPNGATASVFSAEDPDSLRGPQYAAAWGDEVCAWARPEALAQMRLGLRLGDAPQLALTSTPRPSAALRALLAETGLVVTRGSAVDNAEFLAPGYVDNLRRLYGGTRLERQEIDGEVLEALEGAVFRSADLARARALGLGLRPPFERLVVAVDPPAGLDGAACGIVTAGQAGDGAWVLEDRTISGASPSGWAGRVAAAAEAARALGPVSVVAEANQGGEMVRAVLAQAGITHPVRLVHATLGKRQRAEPVALFYEQGRIAHVGGLAALEAQMLLLGAHDERRASPDRADAAVWALTELLLSRRWEGPRVRLAW